MFIRIKNFLALLSLLSLSAATFAVPARRGQWQTIRLTDGTEVRVEARGDEFYHFWQAEDGKRYEPTEQEGIYRLMDEAAAGNNANARRQAIAGRRQQMARRQAALRSYFSKSQGAPGRKNIPGQEIKDGVGNFFHGKKKGLIILVQFSDTKFKTTNAIDQDPQKTFYAIANEEGFSRYNYQGSVRDYFLAQSRGQFDLSFDVVGPVTMPNGYAYYGKNNAKGDELKVGEMVRDACKAVDGQVNYADYDWDGDGEAEEVFVLYAGKGEADNSNQPNLIWPHMYALSGYADNSYQSIKLDGTTVDVYACTSELNSDNAYAGIGTFCHEFSHCMGFPDLYDTSKNGNNYGMGSWDLMNQGSYNGDGRIPAAYTGYEKMVCGWTNTVFLDRDTVVSNMKSNTETEYTFVMLNPNHIDEYYILDNRQRTGYDAALSAKGMLITHIDYDEVAWSKNAVNSNAVVGHELMTIIAADGSRSYFNERGDTYPRSGRDSLTANSSPAATVYHALADGKKFMPYGVYNITQNADGTMSFRVKVTGTTSGAENTSSYVTIFKETFDLCNGTGGNNGGFSGNVASSTLQPDNEGWSYDHGYGADKCARFGNGTAGSGKAVTPAIAFSADTLTLSFRAAAWYNSREGTSLKLSLSGDATFVDSKSSDMPLTMSLGAWTTYTLKIVGTGTTTITFMPSKRFFLDDVLVTRPADNTITDGISTLHYPSQSHGRTSQSHGRIYTIDGRYVGTSLEALAPGIYIVDGKKVVR